MTQINISLNSDLQFSYGEIEIKVSPDANNVFQVKSDGIFLDESLISTGAGFVDQSGSELRIGYYGPFDGMSGGSYPIPGRVSANNIVHRFFTADSTGVAPSNWRSTDVVLSGDIFRVPVSGTSTYNYYLVTNTTTGSSLTGYTNNGVLSYVLLGTW